MSDSGGVNKAPNTPFLPPIKPKKLKDGDKCKMCGGTKFQPHRGLAICPRCDRMKCGKCQVIEQSGLAETCPNCRNDMRLMRGLG